MEENFNEDISIDNSPKLRSNKVKLNEIKNNYNKKYSRGIFPAKSKWNDGKYGGREAKEKLQLSMEFQKKEKQNKFHKNSQTRFDELVHIPLARRAVRPRPTGIEALELRTLPDIIPWDSSSGCSSVSFVISFLFLFIYFF